MEHWEQWKNGRWSERQDASSRNKDSFKLAQTHTSQEIYVFGIKTRREAITTTNTFYLHALAVVAARTADNTILPHQKRYIIIDASKGGCLPPGSQMPPLGNTAAAQEQAPRSQLTGLLDAAADINAPIQRASGRQKTPPANHTGCQVQDHT